MFQTFKNAYISEFAHNPFRTEDLIITSKSFKWMVMHDIHSSHWMVKRPLLFGIVIPKINTIYGHYNHLSNINFWYSCPKIKHIIPDLSLLKVKVKFSPKNLRSLLNIKHSKIKTQDMEDW